MAGAGDWATDDFKTLLAGFGGDGHLVNDKFEPVFDSPEGRQGADLLCRPDQHEEGDAAGHDLGELGQCRDRPSATA